MTTYSEKARRSPKRVSLKGMIAVKLLYGVQR